jgi:hypothetical protein
VVAGAAVLAWLVYWRSLPFSVALLLRRREAVLQAVTRE